jgi:hypothetical protein
VLQAFPTNGLPPKQQFVMDRALHGGTLAEELKSDDPTTVRLLIEQDHLIPSFAKKHHEEMIHFAQTLSGAEIESHQALVDLLVNSKDPRVIAVLEGWLPHATPKYKLYLEGALKRLKAAQTK